LVLGDAGTQPQLFHSVRDETVDVRRFRPAHARTSFIVTGIKRCADASQREDWHRSDPRTGAGRVP
jgi:hypothetical protein